MKVFFSFILLKGIAIVILFAALLPVYSWSNSTNKNYFFTVPTVKIIASTTSLCKGATISFTATVTNAGANPTYKWKVNGNLIAGANLSIYSTADLFTGDMIQCLIDVDPGYPGLEAYNAASNTVTVYVFTETNRSAAITASANDICPGTPVQFSVQTKNVGQNPAFDWQINGKSFGHDPSFTYNNFVDNDKVTCYVTTDNPCYLIPFPSNTITMSAKGAPVINILPADTLVIAGTQLKLQTFVSSSYASFKWEPSELLIDPASLSPQTKPLLNAVDFNLSVSTNTGCVSKGHASVKVFRKLYMPNTFTPNNDGINDLFRIPPDVAMILKEFSIFDRSGNKIFSTNDITKGWDGNYKSSNKQPGIYVYVIKGNIENKDITVKDVFVLIR